MSDAVAKTDLLVRLELAQIASCTCITKTPFYGAHKLDCRYRILVEARERIERLESCIAMHNTDCESQCNARGRLEICEPYKDRGRSCPDCPCDNRITLLDF